MPSRSKFIISPRRRRMQKARFNKGVKSSDCNRPKLAPRMRAISAERSKTSVAVIAGVLISAKRSASSAWLMRLRRSSKTSWETSNFPGASSGVNPLEPTALGIIAPGTSLTLAGFSTPSSSACQIPVTEIEAFFKISSTTLLAVLMSGRAFMTGERPYTSPGALSQRKLIKGEVSNTPSRRTNPASLPNSPSQTKAV